MSGAEVVVGLALGVLPLIVSTIEHYQGIGAKFQRYRRFTSEAQRLKRALHTQETIYRNEVHFLLSLAVCSADVSGMMMNVDDERWADDQVGARIAKRMGPSLSSCAETIEAIEASLGKIGAVHEGCQEVVDMNTEDSKHDFKQWRRKVAQKLKFSFEEAHVDKELSSLRTLNQDLQTLVHQITRHGEATQAQALENCSASLSKVQLEKYQQVHKVSKMLYESLRGSCTKHDTHRLHFSLEAIHTVEACGRVHFSIAFQHASPDDANNVIWTSIESSVREIVTNGVRTDKAIEGFVWSRNADQGSIEGIGSGSTLTPRSLNVLSASNYAETSKRSLSTTSEMRESKRPSLHDEVTRNHTEAHFGIHNVDPVLLDLGRNQNFCTHLTSSCRLVPRGVRRCVGFLKADARSQHLVYVEPTTSMQGISTPRSLQQIFNTVAADRTFNSIPVHERLSFAGSLAMAVLQYHATPWLRLGGWSSSDVFVFGGKDDFDSQSQVLTTPYMNVVIDSGGEKLAATRNNPDAGCIRNQFLFGLAVLLIELAFEAPLDTLSKASDAAGLDGSQWKSFATASRLCYVLGAKMGKGYRAIVEKCLYCFPGAGTTDMDEPGLQAKYYSEVVCELQRLEESLRKLHLEQ